MSDGVISISKRENFLWVEGGDDKGVCHALLNDCSITSSKKKDFFVANNEPFKIEPIGGIDNIVKALKTSIKGDAAHNRYGVVVDADTDETNAGLKETWRRLGAVLTEIGYTDIPSVPELDGTILRGNEDLPLMGIWVMPDNKLNGMIEDFIGFLGPQNDELWPLAIDIVEKVISTKRNFRLSYKSKAYIHTWLAWQEEPGQPMGLAITKKYLDANAEHAQRFVSWIRKLFELEGK
jgi:hypothetical protein